MAQSDPSSATGRIVVARSRLTVGVGAAVVLVLVAIAVAILVSILGASGVTRTTDDDGTSTEANGGSGSGQAVTPSDDPGVDIEASASAVFVHLLGAVRSPGLYELRAGDRIVDAITAAGGFADDAEQGGVNLARPVSDGEQIVVPRIGEALPENTSAGGGGGGGAAAGGTVNLNTADAAELDTLPGVGPATAAAILAWRDTNGRFAAVDDLLSVSGIGDATFAELESLVSV